MFFGSGGVDGIDFSTKGSQFSSEKKDSMPFRTVSKCMSLDHGVVIEDIGLRNLIKQMVCIREREKA